MKHIQLKASWRKFVFLCFLISGFISYAQENITVSGVVRDDNGLLPGVTVIVKGSSQGTTTNFDGEYTLENVSPNATLEFSFIGFQTQEISVNGRSEIDLVMQTDSQALDEVVVIGYGT